MDEPTSTPLFPIQLRPGLSLLAYSTVVRIQMLSELEEILAYKGWQDSNQHDKMDTMKKTWMRRYVPVCRTAIDTELTERQVARLPAGGGGLATNSPSSDSRSQPDGGQRDVDQVRKPLSQVGPHGPSREDAQFVDARS